jgi:ParB family chromosome partitioning protein
MAKRNALGRGLSALIPGAEDDTFDETEALTEIPPKTGAGIAEISVEDIEPNPHQPRTVFDPDAVAELSNSIREKGIIQPISVRRFGDGYQLIAGERRLRAAQLANLKVVPAQILDIGTDEEMMEISLIENVQREDLSPIEEARAYRALMEECFLTQEEVAQKVGKDRSTITNTLRLLNLALEVRDALQAKDISMGHARALLGLENENLQSTICRQVISEGLSVRRVEALVKTYREGAKENAGPSRPAKDPQTRSIEEDLQRRFGTAVNISRKGKKGRIEIEFYTNEDLERLLDLLQGQGY